MEDKRTNIGHKSQVVSHKSLIVAQRHKGKKQRRGTAFILVVMLVTLLSVIGVMFLLRSRVERMSASAIRHEEELNNAVDSAVAAISQQLVLDTPGVDVDANGASRQEYYDYPDPCNAWLANLEPYLDTDGLYKWQQISDVTGYLRLRVFQRWNVSIDPTPLTPFEPQDYINNYPALTFTNDLLNEQWADADGDGIADSKWIELTDALNNPFITTSKGELVYAAIRVVDNGGMLNVNTGYKFEPFVQFGKEVKASDIDGSRQSKHSAIYSLNRNYPCIGKSNLLFASTDK